MVWNHCFARNLNKFYLKSHNVTPKVAIIEVFCVPLQSNAWLGLLLWSINVRHALHDGKASHDALSIGYLKLPQEDYRSMTLRSWCHGYAEYVYPVVCLKANHAFIAHLRVYQQYVTWVSPCSSTCKGCGRPQIADEQMVDTHAFSLRS